MSSTLASDVGLLHGASTEAIAIFCEAFAAAIWGIVLGFYFCWQLALIALLISPLIMVAGAIAGKFDKQENFETSSAAKNANLLAADSIANYKTIASFTCDEAILNEFNELLEKPKQKDLKNGHGHGCAYGFSQCVSNAIMAVLYLSAIEMQVRWPENFAGETTMLALFSMIWGLFTAS